MSFPLSPTANFREQIGRVNRLLNEVEVVPLIPRISQKVRGSRLTGKEKYFAARPDLPKPDCEFHSAHLRHLDITKKKIWILFVQGHKGLNRR